MSKPTHEQIAERAYFIWLKTGGSDVENWKQASKELKLEYYGINKKPISFDKENEEKIKKIQHLISNINWANYTYIPAQPAEFINVAFTIG